MKLPLILATVIACDPRGVPASQTPYASDVDRVRIEWRADATLPADDCHEPDIALEPLPACDGGWCTLAFTLGDTLVIRDGLDDATTRALVRHETVHWLSACTGHQLTRVDGALPWNRSDALHQDPRLWDGVLTRAEASQ